MAGVPVAHRAPRTRTRTAASRVGLLIGMAGLIAALATGCTGGGQPRVEYKPPLLPVKLEVSESGVVVVGDGSIVTFLGTFSVGAKYSLPAQGADTVRVLVLDRNKPPAGFHEIFDVRTGAGEFVAVTNGTTVIRVADRKVEIDVTDGTVEEITFRSTGTEAALPVEEGNALVRRWHAYWDWSPYEPFAFSSWAYDDSTMGKWYGVGFVWFLLRLCLALVLSIADVVLTAVFGIAGVLDVLFGATARNVALGVSVLIGVLAVGGFLVLEP